jgi:4-hydroxythreonine-4-phosphate dehydrogenase
MQPAPLLVKLAITTGEPAGVGPEISFAAARDFLGEQSNVQITLLGDARLLEFAQAKNVNLPAGLSVHSIPLGASVSPGILNIANAQYVLQLLNEAADGCLEGHYDAMITAPVQKSIINDAGIPFTGHTEYLESRCNAKHVVMMLCAPLPTGFLGLKTPRHLRVALVTTHLPLREVPLALNRELILETIQIVHDDLREKFNIANPVIRVAGLNPHAGESGHLGREEIEFIIPAIELAKRAKINVTGPYPGDTMFDASSLATVDAYIAMYHDQGLAPFKFVSFGEGVNVTLGLPIIRTSVDHGTALDIAGKGIADSGSMLEALRLAYQLAFNKSKQA